MSGPTTVLLPNLGAEEGDDWRAILHEPATRVAARLWSLLHSASSELRFPTRTPVRPDTPWKSEPARDLWPPDLGGAPAEAAYAWLDTPGAARAWLATPTVAEDARNAHDLPLAGPEPDCVARVHDKAFALESALDLGLLPSTLAPLITRLEPADFAEPETLISRLEETIRDWPEWTQQSFTLKPRLGSSGRGRVGGRGLPALAGPGLRGALPRLAARGGALLEPWLERTRDLSVCLHVPPPEAAETLPTLVGSLEMLTTRSGGYLGHCGELDHRGRVFSGHAIDEELRGDAARLAARAREHGFFGPCGIDAFLYRADNRPDGREILRPAVELNARITMGLVAAGLVRRALPRVRDGLDLSPGDRRAFLLALLPPGDPDASRAICDGTETAVHALRLEAKVGAERDAAEPIPWLFIARDLEPLREAYRASQAC